MICLSICIPVYNGGERVVKNIERILSYEGDDIEVVISDNQSLDGSFERLSSIDDKRLKVYRNEKNVGAFLNSIEVLKRGTGKYLMLLLDRDVLNVEYLNAYISYLKKTEAGVVLNLSFSDCSNERALSSEESIYWIIYAPHPSYYVYKKTAFLKINISDSIATNGYYPALLALSISVNENVFINKVPIIKEAEPEYIMMHSSRSWDVPQRPKDGGFEWDVSTIRYKQYLNYFREISIELTPNQHLALYKSILWTVSPRYYYSAMSGVTRYRYQVVDYGYTPREYSRLPYLFFDLIKECAKENGVDANTIDKMNLLNKIAELWFINNECDVCPEEYEKNQVELQKLKEKVGIIGDYGIYNK